MSGYISDVNSRLTLKERKAINRLIEAIEGWPHSLTLASMAGTLIVMHTNDEAFQGGYGPERSENVLAYLDGVPNTGGDW